MALNVSVTTGITPKGTNVVIPPANAGIGDLIYGTRSDFQIIGCGTANSTTVNGRSVYGVIYGFVSGMAMVAATAEVASLQWSTTNAAPSGVPIYAPGTLLMRNGLRTSYYAQMNTKQNAINNTYIIGGSAANTKLPSAYQATTLNSSNWSSAADAKRRYGSWWEFVRQTLRVNGAPGTPFGAVMDGCKVHEYGRYVTNLVGNNATYPAIQHCYNYKSEAGGWWLPSMFELGELMIDEHLDKINSNPSSIVYVNPGVSRWSSVLYSASAAWYYYYLGMSLNYGLSHSLSYLYARPVTLFKIL